MTADLSLFQLLARKAEAQPGAPAIMAPGREPLAYAGLLEQVLEVGRVLRAAGVGRHDRVALVVPNGPEMATAFLAVASAAASAPLNPRYRAPEYKFYLSDLRAKALIIPAGFDSPARGVARDLEIPVIDLIPTPERPAGIFRLAGPAAHDGLEIDFAQSEDIALVLHTSGTTSRPKIVPLAQANILASAGHIGTTLDLTPADRCLNIMPLFHIHGLMAAVLSSIAAGASIVCTPGFNGERFFTWLAEFEPTWYTAVPTMHQAILAGIAANRAVVDASRLRFIRSSSASLPPQVMAALEEAFRAPVIESYGMTEAAHQMASNPLPPAARKAGTVGLPAGPEVAIMDEAGALLPAGTPGEIVIRGPNVTAGYENNPAANAAAFTGGWFRTGDQGIIDDDGYLTIVGRLKEMINRGGENIAPREIDELLLSHPGVAQAVAFAVPHRTLGEDLAAAVVLQPGAAVTRQALRQYAFEHLADFKVPSLIVTVDEIPKGPTGKLQRIGLADKLTTQLKSDYAKPDPYLQDTLARIWTDLLGLERVGIHDNFFYLGGDSILGARLIAEIERVTGQQLEPGMLFQAPTIAELSALIQAGVGDSPQPNVVPIQPKGSQRPLFCIPSHEGDPFTFLGMSRYLGEDQPVYTFRFPQKIVRELDKRDEFIAELAVGILAEMRSVQPRGPYLLNGYCYGGLIAFEMARLLKEAGEEVDLLMIVDAYLAGSIHMPGSLRWQYHLSQFVRLPLKEKVTYGVERTRNRLLIWSRRYFPKTGQQLFQALHEEVYIPPKYEGRITLVRPAKVDSAMYHDPQMGWEGMAAEIEVIDLPAERNTVFEEPQVQGFTEHLKRCLARVNHRDPA